MHTNFNLNFDHKIDFTVFNELSESSVEIKFNNIPIQTKTYEPGKEHQETVKFSHGVPNGGKNIITMNFSGETETSNKFIKVHNLVIQKYKLNVLKNFYTPIINTEWWAGLDKDQQTYYKDIIYINNNATFGWYGNIEFEYYSGADKNTAYKCSSAAQDRITHSKLNYIYENADKILYPWMKNES